MAFFKEFVRNCEKGFGKSQIGGLSRSQIWSAYLEILFKDLDYQISRT